MRSLSVQEKHERIRLVLGKLSAAQNPQIRVRPFSRSSAGSRTIRGLLNPAPVAGSPPPRPVDESGLPPDFRPAPPEWAASLRPGEELHVVVDAPRSGYLHVFNLGTSGEASKLLPEPGLRAPVEAGRAYLASPGAGVTPFFPEGPLAEAWVEHGPANGFAERVLAVVTTEDRPLSASRLHPAWGEGASVGPLATSGFAAASIEPVLSAWPASTWSWGYCEIPVTP
jgi:hypothetical protein